MRSIAFAFAVVLCACGKPHGAGDDDDGGRIDAATTGDGAQPADAQVTPTGTGVWQGKSNGTESASVTALAIDTDGSIVAVGRISGSVDFGTGYLAARGTYDVVVVKYGADGTVLWSRQLGACGEEQPPKVAIGPDHAVYVATVSPFLSATCIPYFANAPIPSQLPAGGGFPIVVARYTAAGDETWARAYGSTGPGFLDIAIAVRGDALALVGATSNSSLTDFGSGVTVTRDSGNFVTNVLAVVAASDGSGRWAKEISAQSYLARPSLAIDDDQIVLAGQTTGNIDLGAPQPIVGFGSGDAFLAAYALGDGHYRWHQHLGGPGDDQVSGLARAPDGTFWIAGSFTQTAHFGGAVFDSLGPSYRGYAAHFGADGTPIASFPTLDTNANMNAGVAPFDDGAIVVGMDMLGSHWTAFALRFDGHGTRAWRDDLAAETSGSTAVATGPHAEIVAGGTFSNMLTVPGLPMLAASSSQHNYADAFVARLAP